MLGALASNRVGRLLPPGALLLTVLVIFGAALGAMALPLGRWWPMVPLVLIALSTPAVNVVLNLALARLTPAAMLGRADAVLTVASLGLAPLGPVLGGALAAWDGRSGCPGRHRVTARAHRGGRRDERRAAPLHRRGLTGLVSAGRRRAGRAGC